MNVKNGGNQKEEGGNSGEWVKGVELNLSRTRALSDKTLYA